jgi:probable phosphoglycerate mutase
VLIVVRHGRTAANASGLLLGRLDPGLDPVGETQAEALGAALGAGSIQRVISSPLARTRRTAETIAAAAGGLAVDLDDRWLELDYGELDGTPLGDVPAAIWTSWRADPDFAPPGGESLRSLRARVDAACAELLAGPAGGGDVVVVTHVSPIKAALGWALGADDQVNWRAFVAPASITRIDLRRGASPVLCSFNETGHLPA